MVFIVCSLFTKHCSNCRGHKKDKKRDRLVGEKKGTSQLVSLLWQDQYSFPSKSSNLLSPPLRKIITAINSYLSNCLGKGGKRSWVIWFTLNLKSHGSLLNMMTWGEGYGRESWHWHVKDDVDSDGKDSGCLTSLPLLSTGNLRTLLDCLGSQLPQLWNGN